MKNYKKHLLILLELFLFLKLTYSLEPVRCVLHIHSNYTDDDNYTFNEITELCKLKKIDCVIFTDVGLIKISYGIKPFQNIIKKSVEKKSVFKVGLKKYLDEIKDLEIKNKDLIIIPGLEISPYYYWTYDKTKFVINNWHKHILVFGVEDKNFYQQLPIIENEFFSGKIKGWKIIFISIILATVIFVKLKVIRYVLTILLFTLFFVWFPFKSLTFNQYKDYGELPYQNLFNYITKFAPKNSVTIWAHPDAPNYQDETLEGKYYNKFEIYTKTFPYGESLLKTYGYDGFAIFAEGYKTTGKIGGYWDQVLIKYCLGEYPKPVWCYSEVDFTKTSNPIDSRQNIVFVKNKNKSEIISSLKTGKFYSLCRGESCELKLVDFDFFSGNNHGFFGDTIKYDGPCYIKFKIDCEQPKKVKVQVIKNGKLVESTTSFTPYNFKFVDLENLDNKKNYYRIVIESDYPNTIVTNPIFVEK
jgi:hypothetical protein